MASCEHGEERASLLLITVDTLRADRLGVHGGPRGLTPELDALAARSVVFEQAHAPSSFTFPSISSLFTGKYPEELGIVSNEFEIPEQVDSLATELQEAGYATGAVVSNYVLRRATRLDRGFDHYDAEFPQRERNRGLPERIASATTDAALSMLERLRRTGGDVFLWVHYQDPHGPYTPPEEMHETWLGKEEATSDGAHQLPAGQDHRGLGSIPDYQLSGNRRSVGYYRAGYHAEIRFVDDQIGRLLREAERGGWLSDTAVVFTADHGEGLGEDDYWFAHGEHLTDGLVRVPLFMQLPGQGQGIRTDVVSLLDLHATLLGLLVPGTVNPGHGRDLLAADAPGQNSTVYLASLLGSSIPRMGLVRDGYKYIVAAAGEPRERLHRLGDENRDLVATEPDLLQTMRRQLGVERASLARVEPAPQQPSPEEIERLRSLGYVQ